MREHGRDLDLAKKPLWTEGGGDCRRKHLDGDLAMMLEIFRQVNRSHAAAADLPNDSVA